MDNHRDTPFGFDGLNFPDQDTFSFSDVNDVWVQEDSLITTTYADPSAESALPDPYPSGSVLIALSSLPPAGTNLLCPLPDAPQKPQAGYAPQTHREMERLGIKLNYSDGKRRHNMPRHAVGEITDWLVRNLKSPYPPIELKMHWCMQYDMPMCQLNTFLVNRRIRVLGNKSQREYLHYVRSVTSLHPHLIPRVRA